MNDRNCFDILIVGAGPAGSCAALAAAKGGARVLMIEKRMKIGRPVQCAEFVPRLLNREVNIPSETIAQEVQGMVTFMPDGESIRKRTPGFILDRAKFDKALAMEASKAGAEILTGTRAVSKEGDRVRVVGPSGEYEIRSTIIIGADGPGSVVGSWIGQKNRKYMHAIQHTVRLKQPVSDTEVYFNRAYPGGYAWLFPKGEEANVGVGVLKELGGEARHALEIFKEKFGDRIGEVFQTTAGRIPVGGPLGSIDVQAGIILAGDAAGHTHAITGGGIPQAVIGGGMAGRAAAAFINGDKEAIGIYSDQWRTKFGAMLDKAVKRRHEMDAGWGQENLTGLLKRCWIAYGAYYDGT